jgi:hypothetical protein
MALDGMDCPGNDTECILQAVYDILDAVKDMSRWDPLTFAFTFIIGIVALLFAASTLFLAGIAASPGQLKSSQSTIGPWSGKTTRRFAWKEMRVRSTAHTPIIVESNLESSAEAGKMDDHYPAT